LRDRVSQAGFKIEDTARGPEFVLRSKVR
jgi:hypothetical protein